MTVTRRQLLISAGAAAGGTLLAAVGEVMASETGTNCENASSAPAFKGRIYGLGSKGQLHPGYHTTNENEIAILTSLDLEKGTIRQTPLELRGEAHSAMGATGGRILCLPQYGTKSIMVDADHKVIAEFHAPEGYHYSGHGLVLREQNVFIMTAGKVVARSIDDRGIMDVYDLTTLKRIDGISSGGVHPHEVCKIPGRNELAVTHYGNITVPKPPLGNNVVDAKLTILDATSFMPKRHYPQLDFNAAVTHMRVDKDGGAYFVMAQAIVLPKDTSTAMAKALEDMQALFGTPYNLAIPYQSLETKHLAVPLPFVRIDTQTGKRQIISAGEENHLYSQSVAYNEKAHTAVGLFYHSDTLVLHTPGKKPEVITADQLHLNEIRGVTDISGTNCIAACGTHKGISVMDLATRKVIAHYPVTNYCGTHLYHDINV
jgi:hypothetical protein